jgi:hypothetical protein
MVTKSTRPQRTPRRKRSVSRASNSYMLIVRGADGLIRCERFSSVAEYRTRLAALDQTAERGLSIGQIASLLDP